MSFATFTSGVHITLYYIISEPKLSKKTQHFENASGLVIGVGEGKN